MSAEVQKVLITTFSLVLYSVNLKYLKKEILRVILALYTLYLFIGAGIDMALQVDGIQAIF